MCVERVTVSGAGAVQSSRMGTYTKLASNVTQAGRPVYQLAGSTVAYLFYWPSTSRWLIGSNYTSSSSGVRSTGNGAACPDEATGWEAYTGSGWVSTYFPITVAPAETRPPTTAAPTSVGNAAAISACGPPRCTIGVHSYTTCRTHTAPTKRRMLSRTAASRDSHKLPCTT